MNIVGRDFIYFMPMDSNNLIAVEYDDLSFSHVYQFASVVSTANTMLLFKHTEHSGDYIYFNGVISLDHTACVFNLTNLRSDCYSFSNPDYIGIPLFVEISNSKILVGIENDDTNLMINKMTITNSLTIHWTTRVQLSMLTFHNHF